MAKENVFERMTDGPPVVGSEKWWEMVYPFQREVESLRRLEQVLEEQGREEELGPLATEWARRQVFFFLTEFGFGKMLALQPHYTADLIRNEEKLVVHAFNLRDFGNQRESYENFDGIHSAVRMGLGRVYEMLGEEGEGVGVVRVSPSEFYKKFGSTYDVVEVYRVKEVRKDGSRVIEGRYLVLPEALSDEERIFLANLHGEFESADERMMVGSEGELVEYSIENLVMNPKAFWLGREDNDEVVLRHVRWLNERFVERFGRELVGETELAMYEEAQRRVSENIDYLVEKLLEGDRAFIGRLKEMMFDSQRDWAVDRGIDPDLHVRDILEGRLMIGWAADMMSLSDDDMDWANPFSDDLLSDVVDRESGEFCGKHKRAKTDGKCDRCVSLVKKKDEKSEDKSEKPPNQKPKGNTVFGGLFGRKRENLEEKRVA